MQSGRIALLPAVASARIGSDQTIPSIAQAVEELACNSLDAGATEVQIAIDITSRTISCRDNGKGISPECIALVGERHSTSKLRSLDELERGVRTFGFRGEALHGLAMVSYLEIISCAAATPQSPTLCTVLHLGSRVFTGPSREGRAPGCTVTARDVFANRAVERKRLQRASAAQAEVDASRQRLVRLAVAFPGVAFQLHDAARGVTILETPRSSCVLLAFRRLMGVDPALLLEPLSHEEEGGTLRLTGHVAPPPHAHHTRELQLICVNRRPLGRRCELHRLLEAAHERLRANLSPLAAQPAGGSAAAAGGAGGAGSASAAAAAPPSHPVFLLFLECPPAAYDATLEPDKSNLVFHNERRLFSFVIDALSLCLDALPLQLGGASVASLLAPLTATGRQRTQRPAEQPLAEEPAKKQRLYSNAAPSAPAAPRLISVPDPHWCAPAPQRKENAPAAAVVGSRHSEPEKEEQTSTGTVASAHGKSLRHRQGACENRPALSDRQGTPSHPRADLLGSQVPRAALGALRQHRAQLLASKHPQRQTLGMSSAVKPQMLKPQMRVDQGAARHLLQRAPLDWALSPRAPARAQALPPRRDTEGGLDFGSPLPLSPYFSAAQRPSAPPAAIAPQAMAAIKPPGEEWPRAAAAVAAADAAVPEATAAETVAEESTNTEAPQDKAAATAAADADEAAAAAALFAECELLSEKNLSRNLFGGDEDAAREGHGSSADVEEAFGPPSALRSITSQLAALVEPPRREQRRPLRGSARQGTAAAAARPIAALLPGALPPVCDESPASSQLSRQPPRRMDSEPRGGAVLATVPSRKGVRMHREDLRAMRAVGQFERRFIVAKVGEPSHTLYVIDQHAADERVQLERLLASTLAPSGVPLPGAVKLHKLRSPSELPLAPQQVQLIEAHRERLEAWGWSFVKPSPTCPQPLLLTVPVLEMIQLGGPALLEYLQALSASSGGSTLPPAAALRVLASRACRTALMFGRDLSLDQCQTLLDKLALCQLPFQCAHGRPTVVPIFEMSSMPK